jgi:hypothetical protein
VEKHFVVIGLQDEKVTLRKCMTNLCGRAAEVCGDTEA